jgi:hypothetical protein
MDIGMGGYGKMGAEGAKSGKMLVMPLVVVLGMGDQRINGGCQMAPTTTDDRWSE